MPKKKRMVECVGGPLCGHEMPSRPRVCFVDNDRIPHFYRRINLLRNDHSAKATYYHYFGTDVRYASEAPPHLHPGDRLFRPIRN
jgi:hypothetical protein